MTAYISKKLQVSKLSKIRIEATFYIFSLFCKVNYCIFLYSIAENEVGMPRLKLGMEKSSP
ncbi:MAG TPA: hypothetical protein DIU00_07855 [Phycisphaerales bacterium]|nr:hypothetical protein [Phycisphaerales bacterium]